MLSIGLTNSRSADCWSKRVSSTMAKLRRVYASILVAIYVVATALSSLSLLLCDHHHHHPHYHYCDKHHTEHSIGKDCCDHHHPILGDNHTDYIDSSHRNGSRSALVASLLFAPAVMSTTMEELSHNLIALRSVEWAERISSPLEAHCLPSGLRAPPVLA